MHIYFWNSELSGQSARVLQGINRRAVKKRHSKIMLLLTWYIKDTSL